ncbi:hypothetical protein BGZ99_001819 [Dissophora globulifera]|uniref:Mediator of RNA polymerase II transcription subunit 31 n=1 Tax=Dissophora globulifera TaxID=979702 RepID=A0A9P6RT41_9FUNG|nr:hypothetical protein BGZ99_001819 [Dissophora globulifera]
MSDTGSSPASTLTSAPPLPSGTAAGPLQTEDEYEQLKRFQIELEFVQCLSNPWYLHHLAQQQYFNQDAFVRYLDYLQYFRKPEYAKYIIYPHCLHFLTLLQHKSFRDHLAKQDTATFVHERQYYHWQYLRNQDKVVRMEIMPDGSLVDIKNEPVFTSITSTTLSSSPPADATSGHDQNSMLVAPVDASAANRPMSDTQLAGAAAGGGGGVIGLSDGLNGSSVPQS